MAFKFCLGRFSGIIRYLPCGCRPNMEISAWTDWQDALCLQALVFQTAISPCILCEALKIIMLIFSLSQAVSANMQLINLQMRH